MKDLVPTMLVIHLVMSASAFCCFKNKVVSSRSQSISKGIKTLAASYTSSSSSSYEPTINIDLGPPDQLKQKMIHQPPLNAYRVNTDSVSSNFTIHRVAHNPDIFILKNYLSLTECNSIIQTARSGNMTPAETITNNDSSSRTFCNVTWIPSSGPNKSNLVANIMSSTANLLLSKDILHHPSAGVEDLQVLKYSKGGEFVLHHDGEPRVLTVIYYLNGVAGTWFPLAKTSHAAQEKEQSPSDRYSEMEYQFEKIRNDPQNKQQALDLGKDLVPGKNGLLVKSKSYADEQSDEHTVVIEAGDAVAFYNYKNDGTARLGWRSLHTGLPTAEEEKWIANHWFRVNELSLL